MLEAEKRGFPLEPFLYSDGKLITWAGLKLTGELDQAHLPIPSVTWSMTDSR